MLSLPSASEWASQPSASRRQPVSPKLRYRSPFTSPQQIVIADTCYCKGQCMCSRMTLYLSVSPRVPFDLAPFVCFLPSFTTRVPFLHSWQYTRWRTPIYSLPTMLCSLRKRLTLSSMAEDAAQQLLSGRSTTQGAALATHMKRSSPKNRAKLDKRF